MTDTQPIIDTATAAAATRELLPDVHGVVIPREGHHELIDLERFADHPRRKKGHAKAHDANALAAYVQKHGLPQTEIWADEENTRVVAVINAHDHVTEITSEDPLVTGDAGWGDHRVTLAVRKTEAWEAWVNLDGKLVDQTTFAEHIEDRAVDIVKPTGAEMLELAQSFQAKVGVEFESSKRLSSGQSELVFKETVAAKAGQRGEIEIPNMIELALVPFQGAPAYKVKARFRYRINGGRLMLAYSLERPEDVLREAFADVVSLIANDVDQDVLMGWPE